MTILDYSEPVPGPLSNSNNTESENISVISKLYGSLATFTALLCFTGVLSSILLHSKLGQIGHHEILMFLYNFGQTITVPIVCLIVGGLLAFWTINMRIFIIYGRTVFYITSALTAALQLYLFYLYFFFSSKINFWRAVFSGANFCPPKLSNETAFKSRRISIIQRTDSMEGNHIAWSDSSSHLSNDSHLFQSSNHSDEFE